MKLILLSAALMLSYGNAQGLYEPAPPANSAFVRVAGAGAAQLGSKRVSVEKDGVSPYVVIAQGEMQVNLGTLSQKFSVSAGNFYTVAVSAGKLKLLQDPAADNRAKALLTLYNLSSASLDLKTLDGKTSVLAGVPAGGSASRAVNGITVDLGVFSKGKLLSTLKAVKLERGAAYAVVVSDAGASVTLSSTQTK